MSIDKKQLETNQEQKIIKQTIVNDGEFLSVMKKVLARRIVPKTTVIAHAHFTSFLGFLISLSLCRLSQLFC